MPGKPSGSRWVCKDDKCDLYKRNRNVDAGGGSGGGDDGDGLRLVLYMTYQPCHHSGGRVPKDALQRLSYAASAPQHPTTCSEHLKAYYLTELKPRGIALELVLADVYKATWDEGMHPSEVERRVYGTKSESAREGMRMLLAEGVTMRAFLPKDWAFLVSLCDADVRDAFARRGTEGSPFTRLHMGLRRAMDEYLAQYIVSDWVNDGATDAALDTPTSAFTLPHERVPGCPNATNPFHTCSDVCADLVRGRAAAPPADLLDFGLRHAKGPDGTRGFARGRGRGRSLDDTTTITAVDAP